MWPPLYTLILTSEIMGGGGGGKGGEGGGEEGGGSRPPSSPTYFSPTCGISLGVMHDCVNHFSVNRVVSVILVHRYSQVPNVKDERSQNIFSTNVRPKTYKSIS